MSPSGPYAGNGQLLPTPYAGPSAIDFPPPLLTPTVSAIAPPLGDASGGVPVTITGTNFFSVTAVTINGVACTSVVVVNPTTITAVTPAVAASLTGRDVVVTNAGGPGTLAAGYVSFWPKLISGIQAWYRGDLGVSIGTNVSAWADQSGVGDANRNLTQATGAKQPILTAASAAFNNQATIKASVGAPGTLYMVSGTWSVPLAQPFTTFAVAKNLGGNGSWFFDSNSGGEVGVLGHASNTGRIYAGSFGADVAGPVNVPCSMIAIYDSANTKSALQISQATPQAGANIGTDAPSPLIVFSSQGGTDGTSVWELAELTFWNRDLNTTEIAQLNAYAASRYAIAIGP